MTMEQMYVFRVLCEKQSRRIHENNKTKRKYRFQDYAILEFKNALFSFSTLILKELVTKYFVKCDIHLSALIVS